MAPIVGNLHSVVDTLLSGPSYINSADDLRAPLIILSVFCLFIGALITGLDFLDKKKFRKLNFLKYFLITGVVFLTIDLSYGGYKIDTLVMPFGDGMSAKIIWLMVSTFIAFSIIYMGLWLLRENLPIILVTVFGAIFVSTVAIHASTDRKNQNITFAPSKGGSENLPPVIHIILDEMIGAEGIDRDIPGGEETYQIVRNFHTRFNFRLYGKAFSRHFWSHKSIPNMLNYDYTDKTYNTTLKYIPEGEWEFFNDMQDRGYDVNVYQTSHINFCAGGNIVECKTLNSFNPASIYISSPKKDNSLPLPTNAIILSLFMQKMQGSFFSTLGHRLNKLTLGHQLIKLMGIEAYFAKRYDVQSFDLWFDEFSNQLTQTRGGEVFLSHLLTPHAPIILYKNCGTKSIPWQNPYYLKEEKKLKGEAFQKTRSSHHQAYYVQVACVYKKLTEFMEKIEKLEPFSNATIVINGDHGSRISSGQYWENLSSRDFVDNYSALFSIRSPEVKPGYDLRSVSIQRLFSEVFNNRHNEVPKSEIDTVIADSMEKGRVMSAEMPDYGASSLKAGG